MDLFQRIDHLLNTISVARNTIEQCETLIRNLVQAQALQNQLATQKSSFTQIYQSVMDESILFPPGIDTSPKIDEVVTPKPVVHFDGIIEEVKKQPSVAGREREFQLNVIQILKDEYVTSKIEGRNVIPLLPPQIKALLDPENYPPKKSPGAKESFTYYLSKIEEINMQWIRRKSLKGTLLEAEQAYVLAPKYLSTIL